MMIFELFTSSSRITVSFLHYDSSQGFYETLIGIKQKYRHGLLLELEAVPSRWKRDIRTIYDTIKNGGKIT
jgi:hypothetical protein